MGLGFKPEDSVNWCPRELGLGVCAVMGDDVQLCKVFRYLERRGDFFFRGENAQKGV